MPSALCLALILGALAACSAPSPPAEDLTVWRPLGTWSGRVGQQTDPFTSATGLLRITWEARLAEKAEGPPPLAENLWRASARSRRSGLAAAQADRRQKAEGATFRIIVHSDVSGRPLLVAVDRHGPGNDVTYVTEDPRSFFLVIESESLDWSIAVAEGIPARRTR